MTAEIAGCLITPTAVTRIVPLDATGVKVQIWNFKLLKKMIAPIADCQIIQTAAMKIAPPDAGGVRLLICFLLSSKMISLLFSFNELMGLAMSNYLIYIVKKLKLNLILDFQFKLIE